MTRAFRIAGILIAFTALVPFGVGYYLYRSTESFLEEAVRVEAVVSGFEKRTADGGSKHYPIFTFEDRRGTIQSITPGFMSTFFDYKIGDTVSLLYEPQKPHNARIDSWITLWLASLVAGVIGLIPLTLGLIIALVLPLIVGEVNRMGQETGNDQDKRLSMKENIPAEPAGTNPAPTREERNWALFAHLTSLSLFLGIPFGNILGPLIIWLLKKDQNPFIARHGRESLNFQLSVTLYGIVSAFLCLVLIGFVLLAALGIANFVLVIMAAVKADRGESFRYPLTIRFVNDDGRSLREPQ
ncbi:MAG: DUF4870 domain-containing protein [Chitinivibrionales bacterium]|nr:DUF4870 domain-containing protein [Chitinivibrionales bacterium]MBD3357321.1 DUF4870 domain-containing protein [Chitinivibrionales bacterium]